MPVTPEKLATKRRLWIERTAKALGCSLEEAEALLMIGRQQSLRINTLMTDVASILNTLQDTEMILEPFSWYPDGIKVSGPIEPIRDSKEVEEGKIYIQNAASWIPVLALEPKPGEAILDVCAAPGGKTSHIAQLTNNQAVITANDNSRPRLAKLQRNLERLGVQGLTYTLHDATRLTRHIPETSFDRILLDAPCSGEGMMQLNNAKDFESWSVAHIKRLQQLQKKILVQAWQLLKPGGTLVYSTCTMAPEENEAVIDYLLRHNDDVVIEPLPADLQALPNRSPSVLEWNNKAYHPDISKTLRLKPSETIEAFYVAKLYKQP